MADQADVELALVNLVTLALYPQGTSAPSRPGPVCRVHRGWPDAANLQDALQVGEVHVAVLPVDGTLRVTTRYPGTWHVGDTALAPLRANAEGEDVQFSGDAREGQVAGLLVDHRAYAHRTQVGDTPATVAAVLGARIRRDRPAVVAGPVLSVPGAAGLEARVVADRPAWRETRRQAHGFRVACFCPGPAVRDATAAAIDLVLSDRPFIRLPDGSAGRLAFVGTTTQDDARDALLFRRDLTYSVEYPTMTRVTQAAMLFGSGSLGAISYTN